MDLEKKHFTEIELENLMTEAKTRDITEEETEILWSMYYERWGTGAFGRCLHPYWLLEDIKYQRESKERLAEKKDVKEWRQRAELELFDNPDLNVPDVDINFMCDKPKECSSNNNFGNSCRCIRENFYSETVFENWREEQIKKLGERIKNLIPLH